MAKHSAGLGCPAASHGSHPSHPTEQISHLLVPPWPWLAVPGACGKATATSKKLSARSQGAFLCQNHPDPKPPHPLSHPQPGDSAGQTLLAAAAGFGHLLGAQGASPLVGRPRHATAAVPGRAAGPTCPQQRPDTDLRCHCGHTATGSGQERPCRVRGLCLPGPCLSWAVHLWHRHRAGSAGPGVPTAGRSKSLSRAPACVVVGGSHRQQPRLLQCNRSTWTIPRGRLAPSHAPTAPHTGTQTPAPAAAPRYRHPRSSEPQLAGPAGSVVQAQSPAGCHKAFPRRSGGASSVPRSREANPHPAPRTPFQRARAARAPGPAVPRDARGSARLRGSPPRRRPSGAGVRAVPSPPLPMADTLTVGQADPRHGLLRRREQQRRQHRVRQDGQRRPRHHGEPSRTGPGRAGLPPRPAKPPRALQTCGQRRGSAARAARSARRDSAPVPAPPRPDPTRHARPPARGDGLRRAEPSPGAFRRDRGPIPAGPEPGRGRGQSPARGTRCRELPRAGPAPTEQLAAARRARLSHAPAAPTPGPPPQRSCSSSASRGRWQSGAVRGAPLLPEPLGAFAPSLPPRELRPGGSARPGARCRARGTTASLERPCRPVPGLKLASSSVRSAEHRSASPSVRPRGDSHGPGWVRAGYRRAGPSEPLPALSCASLCQNGGFSPKHTQTSGEPPRSSSGCHSNRLLMTAACFAMATRGKGKGSPRQPSWGRACRPLPRSGFTSPLLARPPGPAPLGYRHPQRDRGRTLPGLRPVPSLLPAHPHCPLRGRTWRAGPGQRHTASLPVPALLPLRRPFLGPAGSTPPPYQHPLPGKCHRRDAFCVTEPGSVTPRGVRALPLPPQRRPTAPWGSPRGSADPDIAHAWPPQRGAHSPGATARNSASPAGRVGRGTKGQGAPGGQRAGQERARSLRL